MVDEPPSLGGEDRGPNPVEVLLAGYVSCLNVMAHLIAAEQNIKIHSLRIEASGPLNPARLFGQPGTDRAGYKNIDVVFHVESDADERALATWLETIQARCPVHDNLTNATPANISLAAGARTGVELVQLGANRPIVGTLMHRARTAKKDTIHRCPYR